jgi:hypothetical protein
MRPVVLHVFDYSLDGIIGEENTEFYDFCRAVPEDREGRCSCSRPGRVGLS